MKKGATYGEALSLSLFMQAIKGKVAAAKEITDRIEGRPLQGLRIERDNGGPVQIEEIDDGGSRSPHRRTGGADSAKKGVRLAVPLVTASHHFSRLPCILTISTRTCLAFTGLVTSRKNAMRAPRAPSSVFKRT